MHLRPLLISLCLLTGPVFTDVVAQVETQTEYAVDIVVFEDSEARYQNSEQWQNPAAIAYNDTQTEISTDVKTSLTGKLDTVLRPNIRSIDASAYDLLDGAVKRLQVNKRYRVLARKSWLQPGLNSKQAVDIELRPTSGQNQATGTGGSISGSVRIVLERYLHLYTNLVYHRNGSIQVQAASAAESPPLVENYVISEHRRMRSRELNYIDHPLIGILIKIVPVETNIKRSQ